MRLALQSPRLCGQQQLPQFHPLYPSASDLCFAKRPIVVFGCQISPQWHNDFVPHMGDSTCSACHFRCLWAFFFKCRTLPLSDYCQSHQEMFLHLVDVVCLFAAATAVIFSYVSHIVGFNAALIGSLVLVLICMISPCYPLFIFPSHTTCFFSLLGFFLHVKLLFSPSYPSVFALSGALMSSCWPSPAVWTRWDGIYSVP